MPQRLTSMKRSRFIEISRGIYDGSLKERWPEGKEAVTKKEQVEERQIKAVYMIFSESPKTFEELYKETNWTELAIVRLEHGTLELRVRRDPRRPAWDLINRIEKWR